MTSMEKMNTDRKDLRFMIYEGQLTTGQTYLNLHEASPILNSILSSKYSNLLINHYKINCHV